MSTLSIKLLMALGSYDRAFISTTMSLLREESLAK